MPVEIRELVIRAEVDSRQSQVPELGQGSANASDREQLVRDCVDQVMEIIRQREER